MHGYGIGERILAVFKSAPSAPYRSAEFGLQGHLVHSATVRKCHFYSYAL